MDTIRQKGHFFRRASLGATKAELENGSQPQDLVQTWLQDPQPLPLPPPQLDPPSQRLGQIQQASPREQRQARNQIRSQAVEIGGWLIHQMVTAPNPLHETVTQIWRDHLIVSFRKFNLPHFLLDYELRLRQHALGDYRDLLWSVTTSPAMLLYLDNQQNRADNLNENYSRELMELFTVGRGHYTEADVQAGARALTGWTIDPFAFRRTGEVGSRFVRRRHDDGDKTFLGHTGPLQAEDVIEILANHPQTARTVSTQLWQRLAYPDPEPEVIDRLAQVYQGQNRSIAAVVEAIFASPEFESERAYRSQIKSPQYFLLGSLRQLQIETQYPQVLQHLRTLSQVPYGAPSVKGWPEERGWLTSVGLLGRLNLAQLITNEDVDESGFTYSPADLTTTDLVKLLLDNNAPEIVTSQLQNLSIREATALILASPTYQLA
ncbi:MAG: DUF1800 family protein [Cyanophyceae cyanobacterium]